MIIKKLKNQKSKIKTNSLKKLFIASIPTTWYGEISPPPWVKDYGTDPSGLTAFLNVILRILFIIAGLWFLFNVVLAGFGFMNASGDAKKIDQAWTKIWQSLVGLVIMVSSFLLAAIIGFLLFDNPTAILAPKLTR